MRIFYFLCFLLIAGLKLNGQYIDNKLDIFSGVGITTPVRWNFNENENFSYPSLFENFKKTLSLSAGVNYWFKRNLTFGLEYKQNKFEHWNGNNDIFILENPELSIHTIALNTGLYYDLINYFKIPGKIGIIAGPEFSRFSVSWTDFNNEVIQPGIQNDPKEENLISPGAQLGLLYQRQINLNSGVRMELSYSLHHAPGLYYLDKSFSSLNFSVKLYFRAMKNRRYNYV